MLPASRQAGQAVVGAALGLYFTPAVLHVPWVVVLLTLSPLAFRLWRRGP